jgi:hypothetical protein
MFIGKQLTVVLRVFGKKSLSDDEGTWSTLNFLTNFMNRSTGRVFKPFSNWKQEAMPAGHVFAVYNLRVFSCIKPSSLCCLLLHEAITLLSVAFGSNDRQLSFLFS